MAAETKIRRSAVLGLLSLGLGFVPLIVLGILSGALYAANKVTFDHDLKNGLAFLLTTHFFFFSPFLHFVGLCVGVFTLFLKSQKKVAAVFGVLLNLALPAIGIVLTLFFALLSAVPAAR